MTRSVRGDLLVGDKEFPRDCKVDTLERSTRRIYLLNRYYDPSTDQFLSVDPDVQSTDQPYAFVNDDPLNLTDPLGQCGGIFHDLCSATDGIGNFLGSSGENFVLQSKGLGLSISGGLLIVGTDSIAAALVVATALGEPEDSGIVPAESGFVAWEIGAGNVIGLGLIIKGLSEGETPKPTPKAPTPKAPTPDKPISKRK